MRAGRMIGLVAMGAILVALISCGVKKEEKVTLQFLQTSDIHNRFRSFEYARMSQTKGGLTRVATLVNRLRSEDPEGTFLIDTGDSFEDNFSEIFLRGGANILENPLLLAMNALGFDLWIPGNHEFNFGVPVLEDFSAGLAAQTLLANVYNPGGERLFKPYTIVERKGVKVGVIGVVTPHITKWDGSNLAGYKVTSPYDEVAMLLPEVEAQSDYVIVATHMSAEEEYGEDSAREIARRFPSVGIVLAAHAHDTVNERVGNVVLLEPAKWGEALGQIKVTFTRRDDQWIVADPARDVTSEVVLVANEIEDPALLEVTKSAHEKAVAYGSAVIGQLVGGDLAEPDKVKGITQAHLTPSPLITLIAEVAHKVSGADVVAMALLRGDANLAAGDIRRADVSLIYKYDNALRVYEMTGRQLKKYMEWAARFYNQTQPGDLTVSFNPEIRGYNNDQFSGLGYDINIAKPTGERIENLVWLKNGKPVLDEEIIRVATTDYRGQSLFEGGIDGVFGAGDATLVRDFGDEWGSNGRIRAMIVKYITEDKGGVIENDLNPALLNFRIVGFNADPEIQRELTALSEAGLLAAPCSASGRESNIRSLTQTDLEAARALKK